MKYSLSLILFTLLTCAVANDTVRIKTKDGKYKDISIDDFFKYHNEPKISFEYKRGAYLIYDCARKSFICVNSDSFDLCKEKREKAKGEELENLSCAPLKEFNDQRSCFKSQIENIQNKGTKIFCFNRRNKLKLN